MKELGDMLAYDFHDLAVLFIEDLWLLHVYNLNDAVYLRLFLDDWAINAILDVLRPFHRIGLRHLLIQDESINLGTEIGRLCHISFQ